MGQRIDRQLTDKRGDKRRSWGPAAAPDRVQYWKDFDSLEAYARNPDHQHLPAWAKFNRLRAASPDVGVWHETYEIDPGKWESIYVNMPPFGLGKVFEAEQISGAREAARGRRDGA